jgi:WD40 repeat protein
MGADSNAIHQRTVELGQILVRLSARADTRQSQPFRTFIDFDSHTSFSVAPRELGRGRTATDPRFGLIGMGTIGEYMVAAHSDTTSLSRLGKVWSIVEADELAQMTIWKISRSAQNESPSNDYDDASPVGDKLYTRTLPEKVNCFRMNKEGKMFMGLSTGDIHVYEISNPAKPLLAIAAHGNSPVVALDLLADDTIVSVSLDASLRISSATSGNLIGGGTLKKRLGDNEIFRCMHVDASSGRLLLGTDKGRIFILDVSSGSPSFLHVMTLNAAPVYCISTSDDSLLIGAGTTLSNFTFPSKGKESQLARRFQVHTFNKAKVKACIRLPGSDLVAAGLGDGSVAIYKSQALVYSRLFAFELVNVLHYSDGTLWAGSDDGRMVEVLIPPTLSEDANYAVSFLPREDGEPKPLPSELSRKEDLGVANVNPSCIKKSAALAEDDSDDEWRRDLFKN